MSKSFKKIYTQDLKLQNTSSFKVNIGDDTVNTATYSTAGTTTLAIPSNTIGNVIIKCWGAGGGGSSFSTNCGGGGGYSVSNVSGLAGITLHISVGHGGPYSSSNTGTIAKGGNGLTSGGAGGSASLVASFDGISTYTLLSCAGGGGGAGNGQNSVTNCFGGGGGGSSGLNGGNDSGNVNARGFGGSNGTGGAGSSGGASNGVAGSNMTLTAASFAGLGGAGANALYNNTGAGGGGYGGGGSGEGGWCTGGGGGGGYALNGSTTAGGSGSGASGGTVANSGDANYVASRGNGGASTVSGQQGLVVIIYTTRASPTIDLADGTAVNPALNFVGDSDTGLYRETGKVCISNNSVETFEISSTSANFINKTGIFGATLDGNSYLDVNGITGSYQAARLKNGNGTGVGVSGSNQILLSYNGTTNYTHAIRSRHYSSSIYNNAFDFLIWITTDASTDIGTKFTCTMTGGRLGVGLVSGATTDPYVLPYGSIHIRSSDATSGLAIGSSINSDNYYWLMRNTGGTTTDLENLYFTKVINGVKTDYGYIEDDLVSVGAFNQSTLNNFTGQHRCRFENDSLYNSSLNKYLGKIVECTGNYKTQIGLDVKEKKDGITINEAIPVVRFCSTRKSKKVFGVLSNIEDDLDPAARTINFGNWVSIWKTPSNDRRIWVNSIGEGALWVCNSNGNLENGDYIQSSLITGYGEKQDDNLLHNYTVAKITCDCDFTDSNAYKIKLLDSVGNEITKHQYNCFIDQGKIAYKCALVGCTYHCG